MDTQAALIERLAAVATRLDDLELVVLHGSTARGTADAGSDVDLAVRVTDATVAQRRRVELAFVRASDRSIDVVFLNDAPPQLRFEVARAGRLVFERAPGLWVAERMRAMVDWWEWAPTARRLHAAAVSRLRQEAREW